jgi:thiamine biosynthesis lipoprotein
MPLLSLRAPGVLLLAILASACGQQDIQHKQSFAFGTLVEIKTSGNPGQQADQAIQRIFSDFDIMHKNWHAWEPGQLTELNARLRTGSWVNADPSLLPLIRLSKQYSRSSDGLFNPAIGNLVKLWGFQQTSLPTRPPGRHSIEKILRDLPTMEDVMIKGEKLRADNPHIQLDLGAIAKGYAMSSAITSLRSQGIGNALVNAGGVLCGMGSKDDAPWRIGIRDPDAEGVLASIELDGAECVFTSGDYERYFLYNDIRYHHIIDPQTGYPADSSTSVTVLHADGTLADAASTALFIAGPERLRDVAENMGIEMYLMIDRKGHLYMSEEMAARVQLSDRTQRRAINIIRSE